MTCENYTYLPGLEEESLEECSSVTHQSQQSKSNHTAKRCLKQGSETESCQSSQFTETSENSTASHGEAQLTLFAEDSRAKTSLQRVKEQELPESVRDFGRSMRESLEKFGLNLSLPKTHHCFELGDLELSSKTWPRWGMMQDGACWELGTLVRPINATECGCWRTPAAREPGVSVARLETKSGEPVGSMCRHYDRQTGRMAQIGLTQQVIAKASWPTPTAAEATKIPATVNYGQVGLNNHPRIRGYPTRERMKKDRKGLDGGTQTQQKWRTPQSRDWKGPCGRAYKGEAKDQPSQTQQAGQLNPSWVEWLMGWPIEWTGLKPLETDKYLSVQQWHSEFFRKD